METDVAIFLLGCSAIAGLACGIAAGWDAKSGRVAWALFWGVTSALNIGGAMTLTAVMT